MTYACAYWPADKDAAIRKEGYDDSKALSAETRQRFFSGINAHPDIGFVLRVISPREISENMLQVRTCTIVMMREAGDYRHWLADMC